MTSSGPSRRTSAYHTQLRQAIRSHLPQRGLTLTCDDRRLRWTPRLLALTAVLMAWHPATTLHEAFAAARETVVTMYPTRRRPGKHLAGFLKTLRRRSPELLRDIAATLRASVRRLAGPRWRWRGWVVLGVDGSRVNCPRTRANEAAFGCAGRRKTAPQQQLTTLFHVATGAPWAWRRGRGDVSERRHLREMLGELPERTLLLADAGFTGYDVLRTLLARGCDFVIRVGRNVTLLRRLGYGVETKRNYVYLWPGDRRRADRASARRRQRKSPPPKDLERTRSPLSERRWAPPNRLTVLRAFGVCTAQEQRREPPAVRQLPFTLIFARWHR